MFVLFFNISCKILYTINLSVNPIGFLSLFKLKSNLHLLLCLFLMFSQHLFVPIEKEVHIYQRDTWERLSSISDSQLSEVNILYTYNM